MNSSRSSSLLVLFLLCVLAVGAAGAVSVSDADAPTEAQVGTDVTATFELTQLYQDPAYEQWTLGGETELANVTWTVRVIDQAGNQLAQQSYDGATFEHDLDIESGASEVHVSVAGTVPPVANYTYEPAETFLVADLTQTRQGGTSNPIETYEAHYYTEDSREARQAIDDAADAIDEAGGHAEAERTLNSAISAYENENFGNAVDLANQAEEEAKGAQSTQQRNRFILMGVGAVVLIGLGVGAVVYWRKSRTHSRL